MIPRKKSSSDASDVTKKVVGSTKKGKKDLIIDQNSQSYFFVKFADGGQLPQALKGRFTRYEFAEHAVRAYLAGK